jgi:subtilisin family serine protease
MQAPSWHTRSSIFSVRKTGLTLILGAIWLAAGAQQLTTTAPEQERFIVRLSPGADIQLALRQINSLPENLQLRYLRPLIAEWNLHLVGLGNSKFPVTEVSKAVAQLPIVQRAYPDQKVEFRRSPNDPKFPNQLDMSLIQANRVWDISTGGLTVEGDTIVVAILDTGFDLGHEDLSGNLWWNSAEIPGNRRDDDGNGLIDDVNGWNFEFDRSDYTVATHGTSVAGIIGAKGNNGKHTAGVNWDVKIMYFQILYTSQVIEAYNYVLKKRRDYNQSQGKKGAFVVVTNASFGISTPCENYPEWGAIYDSLGMEGILSVAATPNKKVDIDQVGDTPAGCPSNYLITVTNTDQKDNFSNDAAIGRNTVDLSAPGDGTVTITTANRTTDNFPGASASSPHVAGAVALLYSLPCRELIADAKRSPAAAALSLKKIILDGVESLSVLQGKTVSGGRLDLYRSMNLVGAYCDAVAGPLEVVKIVPNPAHSGIVVYYITPDALDYQLRVFNALGQLVYKEEVILNQFGEKKLDLDISKYSPGVYFLALGREKDQKIRSFLKF